MKNKEYLAAAAKAAAVQLADNAALHIPLDPDVADFMGAFHEDAISLADAIARSAASERMRGKPPCPF